MWFYILLIALTINSLYQLFMSPSSQWAGEFPWRKLTYKKVIALTFDDGPNPPYTTELLDFLKTEKVRATFFVVGANAEKYPELLKREFKEGHTVANHSYTHMFRNHLLHPAMTNEIQKTQRAINGIIGQSPALFRPPWLWRQPLLLRNVKKMGMTTVSGQFCHNFEVLQIGSGRIAKSVFKKAKRGAIIIFHDGYDAKGGNRSQTVEAAKIVIKKLKRDGYSFVSVDRLLGVKPYLD